MELLERIIEVLQDGEWHDVGEVISAVNTTPLKLLLCLRFLEHYRFVIVYGRQVKLSEGVKGFLEETEKMRGESKVAYRRQA